MIYGIGTDIVEIGRIRDAADKWGERFLKKIYTEKEIAYCYGKKDPFPHLAVRFAAKEAFIKALTNDSYESGVMSYELNDNNNVESVTPQLLHSKTPNFKDIEVLNHPNGKPYIVPHDVALKGESLQVHVTLSHERSHAIATVILERKTA